MGVSDPMEAPEPLHGSEAVTTVTRSKSGEFLQLWAGQCHWFGTAQVPKSTAAYLTWRVVPMPATLPKICMTEETDW